MLTAHGLAHKDRRRNELTPHSSRVRARSVGERPPADGRLRTAYLARVVRRRVVVEGRVQGVGYRAQMQGRDLSLAVGYSRPVVVPPPEGVEFEVEGNTRVLVRGYDKQVVGQAAADVRAIRPPSVPPGTARLRISVNVNLTDDVIERCVASLASAFQKISCSAGSS